MKNIILVAIVLMATRLCYGQTVTEPVVVKPDGADCGNMPTDCEDKEYAFSVCKEGGNIDYYCTSNPWLPAGSKPKRYKIPLCLRLPQDAKIPSYLTRAQIQNALDVASYEWNCICGAENTPVTDSNCCIDIVFFFNPEDAYGNPKENMGYTGSRANCDGSCYPGTTIYINASDSLEDKFGQWKTDNNSWFNLITVIQHEAGHDLGMEHLNGESLFEPLPCQNPSKMGVMNMSGLYSTWDKNNRPRLTNDDKCYFKKLYCPNGPIHGVHSENSLAFSLPAYPNPARDIVNIPFSLVKQSSVKIVVYNEKGEKVYTALDVDKFPAGEHSIYYNTLLTSNGNYFYTIEANGTKTSSKFVVKR